MGTFKRASIGLNMAFWAKITLIIAAALTMIYAMAGGIAASAKGGTTYTNYIATITLIAGILVIVSLAADVITMIGYGIAGTNNGYFIAALIISVIQIILSIMSRMISGNSLSNIYRYRISDNYNFGYYLGEAYGKTLLISLISIILSLVLVCCVCTGVKRLAIKINDSRLAKLSGTTKGFYITFFSIVFADLLFYIILAFALSYDMRSNGYRSGAYTALGIWSVLFVIILIVGLIFGLVAGILYLVLHKSAANAFKTGIANNNPPINKQSYQAPAYNNQGYNNQNYYNQYNASQVNSQRYNNQYNAGQVNNQSYNNQSYNNQNYNNQYNASQVNNQSYSNQYNAPQENSPSSTATQGQETMIFDDYMNGM